MADGAAGLYYSPQNPGLATVLPTGTQAQVFQQLSFLARLKDANEQKKAAQAAKQQDDIANMYKDAMTKGISVQYQPYRKDISERSAAFQKEYIEAIKQHGANIPTGKRAELSEREFDLKRRAESVNAVEKDLNTYFANIPKDSPIDRQNFSANFARLITNEDGTLKNPEDLDLQTMIEQVENDPTSYDLKKVNEAFVDSVKEEVNSFVSSGVNTREEFQVNSKFLEIDPNTGMPVMDPETNLPAMKISPEQVQRYKSSPGGKAILEGIVNQMYTDGYEGSIGAAERSALGQILRSYAYRNVPRRNIENQPKETGGKATERQEMAFNRFEGYRRAVEGDDTELRRVEGGKTAQGTIKSITPGAQFQSFIVTFEGQKKIGSSTIPEEKTEYFNIRDKAQADKFATIYNEALNSKSSSEKEVPWEDIRSFNDQYRKRLEKKLSAPTRQQQTQKSEKTYTANGTQYTLAQLKEEFGYTDEQIQQAIRLGNLK